MYVKQVKYSIEHVASTQRSWHVWHWEAETKFRKEVVLKRRYQTANVRWTDLVYTASEVWNKAFLCGAVSQYNTWLVSWHQYSAFLLFIYSTNYCTILILLLHIVTYDLLLHVSTLIRHLQRAFCVWLKLCNLNFNQAQKASWIWRINVETCRSKSYEILCN